MSSLPSWLLVCFFFFAVQPLFSLDSKFVLGLWMWFIGASGTGRTTFVNTLCESEVLAHKISDNPDGAHVEEGIRIKPVNVGELNQQITYPPFHSLHTSTQNSKRMVSALR